MAHRFRQTVRQQFAHGGAVQAARHAFTLVELLIVVVILGILAAVVIPQFTDVTEDGRLSALTNDLGLVRKQLQVYRMQHNGDFPALDQFVDQMTSKTNADGTTTGSPNYGPYIDKLPVNPYTQENSLGNGGIGTSAWYYDEANGTFRANCHTAHAAL